MRIRAGILAAAVALLAGAAAAQTIEEAARRAESLLQAGKPVEALQALDAAAERIWRESPLTVRRALPVRSSEGFGIYEPLEAPAYRPGDTVRVYAEPVGFAYGARDGGYTIALEADLALENPRGQVIAEGEDLFSIEVPTHEKNREFNVTLSFELPELRPGDYRAVFTVRDRNSDKTGSFEVPITVAGDEGMAGATTQTAPEDAADAPATAAGEGAGATAGGSAAAGADATEGGAPSAPAAEAATGAGEAARDAAGAPASGGATQEAQGGASQGGAPATGGETAAGSADVPTSGAGASGATEADAAATPASPPAAGEATGGSAAGVENGDRAEEGGGAGPSAAPAAPGGADAQTGGTVSVKN